jgi:hypothetical protein
MEAENGYRTWATSAPAALQHCYTGMSYSSSGNWKDKLQHFIEGRYKRQHHAGWGGGWWFCFKEVQEDDKQEKRSQYGMNSARRYFKLL